MYDVLSQRLKIIWLIKLRKLSDVGWLARQNSKNSGGDSMRLVEHCKSLLSVHALIHENLCNEEVILELDLLYTLFKLFVVAHKSSIWLK